MGLDIVFDGIRVPWNSTEYSIELRKISSHSMLHETFIVPWISMEFLPGFRESLEFREIPRNLVMEPSFMELLKFHGIRWNVFQVCGFNGIPCNSMEFGVSVKFHGILKVPLNSMEPSLWHRKVSPWNFIEWNFWWISLLHVIVYQIIH